MAILTNKNAGIEILLNDLKMLYEYLLGANHASCDENASTVASMACHKIDEIMGNVRSWNCYNPEVKINDEDYWANVRTKDESWFSLERKINANRQHKSS